MRRLRVGMVVLAVAASALSGCGEAATSAQGTWGSSGGDETRLTFTGEGLITGTDGCNRLSGTWQQDGDDVTLAGLATTLMACPDVDVWLIDPASAVVDGDTMHLYDSDGAQIGDLSRE
ncbi:MULTISPECIES: META domain-containing protein [unclassified Pseudactinotalea]|uniref:META domain-containing protein n=1 Tax=unclassified Pseudactinotalea TaxID=2649176 RepID=UPI00128BA466|nr:MULTISPECIES: META domain-containing protein [unclassified Pseudactinotalea]MPV49256.1 META domain-containing protein [Pseudactinotalea sp. HY160]QGH69446.1 META domain-containing protein [Pseudactinotalea sp. HY158]